MSAADDLGITAQPVARPAAGKAPGKAPGGAAADLGIGGAAAPAASASPSSGPNLGQMLHGAERAVTHATRKPLQAVGNALVYGHKHPFDAVTNVLGSTLRGGESFLTGGDIGHAIMHPTDQRQLSRAVDDTFGLTKLKQGPLAGTDLPHKLARGGVDTFRDIAADAMTYVPGPDIFSIGKHLAPLVPDALKVAGTAVKGTRLGRALDGEAPLAGLTDKGKATFQAIQNRAADTIKALAAQEEAVVRKYADDIRAGRMPEQVVALFRKADNVPAARKGMRPQEVVSALARDRAPIKFAQINRELRNAGLINGAKSAPKVKLKNPGDYFVDPATMDAVKKQLGKVANPRGSGPPNLAINLAKKATRLGNKAFLANPVPHTLNLTNLAYNRYGLPTTIRGLANAARVATGTVGNGKLAGDISALEQMGAKSQYGNIFDELGLTGTKWVPGSRTAAKVANKVLIPAQKLSNLAQHKILNSTETGLRAAALNAERKGGTQGVEAARKIHQTFGTGPMNEVVRSVSDLGTPFAQFHLATAPMSGIRTLATHPARVANVLKANRDMNAQVNPGGPQYRSSVPSMATAKALADPLSYFSNLGPLSQLDSPYGTITQLEKGPKGLANVLGDTAGRYIPGSQEASALYNMATGRRGPAGEKAMSDLITALVGGYFQKKRP
jgi:hypothetical protein